MNLKNAIALLPFLCFALCSCASGSGGVDDNYKNIKNFWTYCNRCISSGCEDEKICAIRMKRESLKTQYISALYHQNIEAIEFFIDTIHFDVNEILDDEYFYTALSITASQGGAKSEKIAKLLIEKGANVNAILGGSSRTPLLTAIWKKNNDVARLLLQNGADPKIPNDRGYDACIHALRWFNFEIMPDLPNCCDRMLRMKATSSGTPPEDRFQSPDLVKYCKKPG
jgi:ankyrin repeat protein